MKYPIDVYERDFCVLMPAHQFGVGVKTMSVGGTSQNILNQLENEILDKLKDVGRSVKHFQIQQTHGIDPNICPTPEKPLGMVVDFGGWQVNDMN
jgi:hypothetical protein